MNMALKISAWLRMLRMRRADPWYEFRMFSIPSLVICVMWITLWFLWPHGDRIILRRQPHSFSPRVVFVSRDIIHDFKLSSFDALKPATDDGDAVTITPWMAERPARILERNVISLDESAGGKISRGGAGSMYMGLGSYKPVWQDIPVFKDTTNGMLHITVEPMGILKDYGFKIPEFTADLKKIDKPWSVTVFVEIDGSGKVDNVFLESGSGNNTINSIVVKSMYRGILPASGTRCDGRVKVSFGSE